MIAILSDFGNSEYLGVMKGVIYSISSNARVVDLCNTLSPQNIREGAWILLTSCKYFPVGTIFLCVVDPGVGEKRQAVAVKTRNYYYVGPDNGLMYPAITYDRIVEIRSLPVKKSSMTFHGRDIFSVYAAKLENGTDIREFGKDAELMEYLNFIISTEWVRLSG